MLTAEQAHDLAGVLLAGFGLLCLVALVVHGAPLLDGLRELVLVAVGYGWPLVLGSAIAGGVLLVWPEPVPSPSVSSSPAEGGEKPAAAPPPSGKSSPGAGGEKPAPAAAPSLGPWTPSWLEAAGALVGLLAALGLLSLGRRTAGGDVGDFGRWLTSPAGPVGGLFVLLLVLLLAAIVVLRLSPGRAGRNVVRGGRIFYRQSASGGRKLSRTLGRFPARSRIAGQLARLHKRLLVGTVVTSARAAAAAVAAEPPATDEESALAPTPVAALGATAGLDHPAPSLPSPIAEDAEQAGLDEELAGDARETTSDAAEEPAEDRAGAGWTLPGLDLLAPTHAAAGGERADTRAERETIEGTLASFGIVAKVVGTSTGPAVTRYAVRPAPGVQVRKVVALQNDLALALGGVSLRVEAPIPGQSAIGIEVPNKAAALVSIGEVVRTSAFGRGQGLTVVLGKDVAGRAVVGDLTRMPHLLVAGATGQGKSVCVNTLLASLLLRHDPDRLQLVMIDPKRVELQGYNGLPHLAAPIIVDPQQAASALRWAVAEMERRYRVLEAAGERNIAAYNPVAVARGEEVLAYVVIVIDELADLMMVAAGEIEELVCRIAQLARAVGIHLVIATQRPSRDIITGLIQANVPSRIAFAVGSQVDSRVILDTVGAEKLLGRGDMLYKPVDADKPVRLQGAFISDRELEGLVEFWRAQGEPRHLDGVLGAAPLATSIEGREERRLDPLFARAARAVAAEGAASVSLVQRKFNVGYSRAGRIVDTLAEHRVIGAYQGSKSREVLMNLPDVDELLERLGMEG